MPFDKGKMRCSGCPTVALTSRVRLGGDDGAHLALAVRGGGRHPELVGLRLQPAQLGLQLAAALRLHHQRRVLPAPGIQPERLSLHRADWIALIATLF